MTYSGTSDAVSISGLVNICIEGDTLDTVIEYSPNNESNWFTLQEPVGSNVTITTAGTFNLALPSGEIRFNGGTNVTVFVTAI